MQQKKLLIWHRRLGLVLILVTMAFAISGLSRTVTKALQPPQGTTAPSDILPPERHIIAPATAIAAAGLSERPLSALRLRSVHGELRYQLVAAAPPRGPAAPRLGDSAIDPEVRWVSATSGALIADGDAQAAVAIAQRELAQPEIREARLDAFDREYGFIQRLLPVWRVVDAQQPSRQVTVSTVLGSISSRHNSVSRSDRFLFSFLHKFFFIPNRTMREGFAVALCAGILLLGLSGLWLSWRVWRRGALRHLSPPARRAHMWLGLFFGGFASIGAASGTLHTVMIFVSEPPPRPEPATALGMVPDLPPPPLQQFPGSLVEADLRRLGDEWAWRLRSVAGPPRWLRASDGKTMVDGEGQALQQLAQRVWGSEVRILGYQEGFDNDYPFINKLLPVWRVEPVDAPGTTLYLSTEVGTLARKLDPWDRVQVRLFSWLHSWRWLPEPLRVLVLICGSGGMVLLGVSGVWLWRPAWLRRGT